MRLCWLWRTRRLVILFYVSKVSSLKLYSKYKIRKYVFEFNVHQKQFSIWSWQYTLDNFKLRWNKAKFFLLLNILWYPSSVLFVDSIDGPLLAVEYQKAGLSVLCIQSQSPPIIFRIQNKKVHVFEFNVHQKQFLIWRWQFTLDNFKLKWNKAKFFLLQNFFTVTIISFVFGQYRQACVGCGE